MLVYDIEIAKAIPDRKAEPIPGIEYCQGWGDHAGMGIAVICAFDYKAGRNRVFFKDNIGEFAPLLLNDGPLIGFNHIGFDNKVLAANGITVPEGKENYDILVEIWKGAGLAPTFSPRTHGGFGLDACAKANFGAGKTGHGALAPVQFQRGEFGAVVDYCLEDVRLTQLLLNKIISDGFIQDPRDPSRIIEVRKPF